MKRLMGRLRRLRESRLFAIIKRFKVLQFLIPAAVIAFVYWQGRKEFHRIDWAATLHVIRGMPPGALAFLFAFSLMSVAVIAGYDFIIRRHFHLPIGKWAMFRYAWIANSSNAVIGFAGIAGVGLRTVLFRKWNIPLPTIAASIAYLSTVTITGLCFMAWAGIAGILPMEPVLNAHPLIRYVVWADALFLPAFIILQRTRLFSKWFNRDKGLMDWGTIFVAIGISVVEWVLAGITFWLIGIHILPGLHVRQALGIFTVAAVTGLVSMAPGGIGGFDLTALLGLGLLGYDPGRAAAVLVLYRLLYYIAPWVIGLVMAAFEFTVLRKKTDDPEVQGLENVLSPWQKIWHWPGQFRSIGEIGVWSLGKLVFASGLLLLLSAATPRLLNRLRLGHELLSEPLMQMSRHLSVIVGLTLIVLSWGISHRVKQAYWWTFFLLASGIFFTFTKAFDYEEAIFLFIVCLLLWISRHEFYREAAPFNGNQPAKWGLTTLVVTFLYLFIGRVTHPELLHMANADASGSPRQFTVSALVGLAVTWLVIVIIVLLRPARRIGSGIAEFKASGGQVTIPYTRIKDKLVMLREPSGSTEQVEQALQEFRRFADQYSFTVVSRRDD